MTREGLSLFTPLERATARAVSCWQWSASEQTSALVRSISDRSLRPTGISRAFSSSSAFGTSGLTQSVLGLSFGT